MGSPGVSIAVVSGPRLFASKPWALVQLVVFHDGHALLHLLGTSLLGEDSLLVLALL